MADKMKKCVILGSVPEEKSELIKKYCKDSYLICADGGYDTAVQYGIVPDLAVGDFDSAQLSPPNEVETIRLSTHKDDTDMMFAIKEGFRRGFHQFVLMGALGGERFDHSIANLSALYYIAVHGGTGVIVDSSCEIFLLTSGRLTLTQMKGCMLSVFPFGVPLCNVTYYGLEYPLTRYSLRADEPLGVSNEIIDDHAEIILHEGTALIIAQSAPK